MQPRLVPGSKSLEFLLPMQKAWRYTGNMAASVVVWLNQSEKFRCLKRSLSNSVSFHKNRLDMLTTLSSNSSCTHKVKMKRFKSVIDSVQLVVRRFRPLEDEPEMHIRTWERVVCSLQLVSAILGADQKGRGPWGRECSAKQIVVSFSCICPVTDHEFRHNVVKVAVDPRGDSRVDPQTTLTPLTPLLIQLHWLPVSQHIIFKILLLTFKALNGLAPMHITELLDRYVPPRPLRSSTRGLLGSSVQY